MKPQLVRSIVIDTVGIIGLLMLSFGLWNISPVHMFTVVGALLIIFALSASYFSARSKRVDEAKR